MSDRYRYARHIAWQVVGGEVLVVDIGSGRSLGLNRSASFIFANLEQSTFDDLATEFASRFQLVPSEAGKHVAAFLEELMRRNVIERAA